MLNVRPRHGSCTCDCHVFPGVHHIAPCCYPLPEESGTYPTPFTERPMLSPTPQMRLDLYRDWLMSKCSEQRMQEVVKIQQALHDPYLRLSQIATLRRMWPIAYAAYTDPFGAKTYA